MPSSAGVPRRNGMVDVTSPHVKRVTALFDSVAASYEAVGVPWFGPIAERLVDELDIRSGDHVLDVGCGRGAAIPALSAAVGRSGRVVGVDLSAAMLEQARRGVSMRGLHNVEFHHMDAAVADLPADSFSVVSASLVLPFLDDPVAALRHWCGLLVPTGRLGVTTHGAHDVEWDQLQELFEPYLTGEQGSEWNLRPELDSDGGVESLLVEAGFVDVRSVGWEIQVSLDSATQWRTWTMSHAMRSMWQAVPSSARDELQRRAAVILDRRAQPGGPARLNQIIRITTGRRPRF